MLTINHSKNVKFFLLICGLFFVISSCTIQKRSFNRGYHIEWKTKLQNQPQDNVENKVLLSSSKRVDISDSSTKNDLFSTDIKPLTENEVFSEEIKIQDLKENILHKENDDTVEMYTYSYKDKTIVASKEDIHKVEKKRKSSVVLLIFGMLLLIVSIGALYAGATSFDLAIAVLGILFGLGGGVVSIILLVAALLTFLSYKDFLKKIILKNNAILEGKEIESTTETDPRSIPNPHSKRNFLIFAIISISVIIGFIVFKNS